VFIYRNCSRLWSPVGAHFQAISATGAVLLRWTVPAARYPHRGKIWCLGASLSRLLPVIEINKELTDFFNDPSPALQRWQAILFSVLGVIGWLLGAVLVIAFSGLTQSS
jgi:hypothetical protein